MYGKRCGPSGVQNLSKKRYVVVVFILGLALLGVLSVRSHDLRWLGGSAGESNHLMLDQSMFAVPMAPKPSGTNVSVIGVLGTYTIAPVCKLSNPPCAIRDTRVYYVTVNSRNYRLIFQNGTSIPEPFLGSLAVITGIYVTPSQFQADQYTPLLYFYGDIYVRVIAYIHTLPH